MTEFGIEAQLSFSDSSIKGASKQLQRGINDVSIGVETGGTTASRMSSGSGGGLGMGAASTAVGTKLSGMSTSLEDTLALDEERNTVLSELLEATERNAGSGGGGGGISGLLTMGGVASMLSGGLTSLIPSVGLGSLVTKASFKSLLKKTPALATLVTGASLTDDLINGTLGPDDLVDSAISVGEIMSFDMLDNKFIEGAIGTVTLSYGAAQIGSLVTGTLSSSALSGYLGGTGLSSLIGSGLGAGKLSTLLAGSSGLAIGSILAPLAGGALAGYLGSVGIEKLIDMHDGAEGYNQDTSKSSAGTDAAQQGGVDFDSLEGVDAPDVENPRGHIPASEAATAMREVDSNPNGVGEGSSSGGSGSGSGEGGSANSSRPNRARENTSQTPRIDYTANYDLTAIRDLERKVDKDLRELKRELEQIQRSLNGR